MSKYIVAYPRSLRTFDSLKEAEALADTLRDFNQINIYKVTDEVFLFPKGNPGPKDPKPPGTPVAATKAA